MWFQFDKFKRDRLLLRYVKHKINVKYFKKCGSTTSTLIQKCRIPFNYPNKSSSSKWINCRHNELGWIFKIIAASVARHFQQWIIGNHGTYKFPIRKKFLAHQPEKPPSKAVRMVALFVFLGFLWGTSFLMVNEEQFQKIFTPTWSYFFPALELWDYQNF